MTPRSRRRELLDSVDWLEAERYTAFICDQHLRGLAFLARRLAPLRGGHLLIDDADVVGWLRRM